MCFFSMCAHHLRAGTLAVKDTASTLRSISTSVAGATEPAGEHDGGLNQTEASDKDVQKEGEREGGSTRLQLWGFFLFLSLLVLTDCLSATCALTTDRHGFVSVSSCHTNTHTVYVIHVCCTVHTNKNRTVCVCVSLSSLSPSLSCGLAGLLRLHRACCVVGSININTNMFPRRLPQSVQSRCRGGKLSPKMGKKNKNDPQRIRRFQNRGHDSTFTRAISRTLDCIILF